jgi:DNA-binding YbaB/EbfC family protein
MNIQALMKQAQAMQKNIMESKKKIEEMAFEGNSELVIVKMNGKREVISVKIKNDASLEKDDLEILEDMIAIATNDALSKIEKEINDKLGSQAGPLGNLL